MSTDDEATRTAEAADRWLRGMHAHGHYTKHPAVLALLDDRKRLRAALRREQQLRERLEEELLLAQTALYQHRRRPRVAWERAKLTALAAWAGLWLLVLR